MKETKFRSKFIKETEDDLHCYAVENSVGPGTPDISGLTSSAFPVYFWIELKVADDNEPIKFQDYQPNWIKDHCKKGGNIFIMVLNTTTKIVYVFDGIWVDELVNLKMENETPWLDHMCLMRGSLDNLKVLGSMIRTHLLNIYLMN